MSQNFKITYSALNANMDEIHKAFDQALATAHSHKGEENLSLINGQKVPSSKTFEKTNPANKLEVLAKYHLTTPEQLDQAFDAAKKAEKTWRSTPWQERIRITRKAAELIRSRRMEIAVNMALEVGKNRMESLGDAEESADLLDYYAHHLEEAQGGYKPLNKLSPNEKTGDHLRPYGVFSVIAPFNFPMALGAGMASAAILGGNCVILKPSEDAPGTAKYIYECYRDAGLPTGVLQVVYGMGPDLGIAMVSHPKCDGIAFTGSKAVGLSIQRTIASGRYLKPVLAELGGKNATFICETADLDKAAKGCVRSAFGLTGQKCSALSRIYVHESVKETFFQKLTDFAKTLKIGNPTDQSVYMGPIINPKARERHLAAIRDAKVQGKIIFGGTDLTEKAEYQNGHFVDPTIALLPREARHFKEEFFSPFIAVTSFTDLSEAIQDANTADYGLTGGIFSSKQEEIDFFFDHYEAGVLYANRETGATTGAWPGVQSFCGWKGSGTTGKGGCGPYYVFQFMREQSRTQML